MPCYSPLKGWIDANTGGIRFDSSNSTGKTSVACGQCLGCRLDRSRMWAIRISHEAGMFEHTGGNCFVTLTYRDESECTLYEAEKNFFVPSDWSLHRKHFVDFMKRLRRKFPDDKLRFYMAGEYGNRCKHGIHLHLVDCPLCNVGRPHFHACLFNCSFPDLEPYGSRDGDLRYTSPFLASIWKYGFVDVGELNFDSAAYVARYILKKVTGKMADDHYMSYDLDGVITFIEPEYSTMSRGAKGGHGIGWDWFQKYKADVFPSDEVPVPGSGVFKNVPRYYEDVFKEESPLALEEIKRIRQAFYLKHKEDYTPERLMDKYRVKKAQIKNLTRSL